MIADTRTHLRDNAARVRGVYAQNRLDQQLIILPDGGDELRKEFGTESQLLRVDVSRRKGNELLYILAIAHRDTIIRNVADVRWRELDHALARDFRHNRAHPDVRALFDCNSTHRLDVT